MYKIVHREKLYYVRLSIILIAVILINNRITTNFHEKNINIITSQNVISNVYDFIVVDALIGPGVREADVNEFPAVVALAFINDNCTIEQNVFCTGTLITRSHILTSEHCFDITRHDPYIIIADSYNLSVGVTYYPSWWLSYDQWCVNRRIRITEPDNDLAIVKIFLHVTIRSIPMTRSNITRNRYFFERVVQTAGWGEVENGVLPTILHAVNMTVISNVDCNNIFLKLRGRLITVPGKYLCTQDFPFALTTPGDSGNPLINDGILIAITKGAIPILFGQFHPEKANVHLTIQRYNHFIQSLIREY